MQDNRWTCSWTPNKPLGPRRLTPFGRDQRLKEFPCPTGKHRTRLVRPTESSRPPRRLNSTTSSGSSLHNCERPSMMLDSFQNGWVPEWSNGLAWKACVPQKGTEGSNPSPSAIFYCSPSTWGLRQTRQPPEALGAAPRNLSPTSVKGS